MRIIQSIIIAFSFLLFVGATSVFAQTNPPIYFFYGTGCPHCALVEQYFEEEGLFNKYPIEKKEIYFNRENAVLFNSLMDEYGVPQDARGVPAVVLGGEVLIGDKPIIDGFISKAEAFIQNKEQETEASPTPEPIKINVSKDLTILAVVAGALVDAINPCEFAVLIILMTTILASGKAKKALASGLAFSASIFISYFLMGLGLYSALGVGSVAHVFYKIVGWLAIILGLFNLKDYFWCGKGFLMEVPLSWRPKLKSLIHSVTSPVGAFGIGFIVSLFLLPCTSGPYIVILGMLAKKVQLFQTISYLLLYNLIFISPMVLISYAVYKGYDPNKAEEIRQKRLRTLHLIAGIIMLSMGFVVLRGWI